MFSSCSPCSAFCVVDSQKWKQRRCLLDAYSVLGAPVVLLRMQRSRRCDRPLLGWEGRKRIKVVGVKFAGCLGRQALNTIDSKARLNRRQEESKTHLVLSWTVSAGGASWALRMGRPWLPGH